MLGTGDRPATRALTLLTWCAAASLGVLFIKVDSLLNVRSIRPGRQLPPDAGLVDYLLLAALALALILWRVFPRRSWPWLLLAGAVGALPLGVLRLAPDDVYRPWMDDLLAFVLGSASAFTLVGVLAAATWVWQAGRRGTGAALVGTALVIQLLGPVVILSTTGFRQQTPLGVLSLALVVVAIAGGIGAVIVTTAIPLQAPVPAGWRGTMAGGLAAMSPVLALVWRPDVSGLAGSQITRAIADHYLYLGLAFLAIGLVAGMAAGERALATAVAAGLLLGTFGMLITPSVEVLSELGPVVVIAAGGSVLLAHAAARSAWRARIGAAGLGVVAAGLIVLFGLFDTDSPREYEGFANVLTPILLVVGVVAAVAVLASAGSVLAVRSETPAVLAGLMTPFALGAITIIAYFTLTAPRDRAPVVGLLPPAAGGLLIVAGLIVLIARRYPEADQPSSLLSTSDTIGEPSSR